MRRNAILPKRSLIILAASVAGIMISVGLAKAQSRLEPVQLLKDLSISAGGCFQQPELNCAAALELLKAGDYRQVQPDKVISSRENPEFRALFSRCKLAPPKYSENLNWDAVKDDPFYGETGTPNHVEGQYLAYGPFDVYDIKLSNGRTRRIIEATGYKGLGAPLSDQHTFALQLRRSDCALKSLAAYGYYSSDEHLASWGAVISLKRNVYVATYQAWGKQTKSGAIKLAPVGVDMKNRYSIARAAVEFTALDPRDN